MFGGGFMFYLSSASSYHNKYGIVDTRDGIVEFITKPELTDYISQGVEIITKEYNLTSEFQSLDKKMNYKLFRECIKDNAKDFLKNHALPSYDFELYKLGLVRTGVLRVFDYKDTKGFYIIIFELQSLNSKDKYYNIAVVSELGLRVSDDIYLCDLNKFKEYPCGSGFLHQNVDKQNYGLNNNDLYLRLPSAISNDIIFIRIPDFKSIRVSKG